MYIIKFQMSSANSKFYSYLENWEIGSQIEVFGTE